ncbi:MAG TPA: hypothetical protein VLC98_00960 [Phnomibacter sp.]|nr:hypothetical protein [Phnomibacter sp.]
MKKYFGSFFLFLVLLCWMAPAQAQGQQKKWGPPEDRAAKITSWMKTNLQLNPSQEAKVKEINLRYAKKAQEVVDGAGNKMEKGKKIRELEKEKEAEFKSILTAEQFSTYETKKNELKKQLKEKAKQHKESGGGSGKEKGKGKKKSDTQG